MWYVHCDEINELNIKVKKLVSVIKSLWKFSAFTGKGEGGFFKKFFLVLLVFLKQSSLICNTRPTFFNFKEETLSLKEKNMYNELPSFSD